MTPHYLPTANVAFKKKSSPLRKELNGVRGVMGLEDTLMTSAEK